MTRAQIEAARDYPALFALARRVGIDDDDADRFARRTLKGRGEAAAKAPAQAPPQGLRITFGEAWGMARRANPSASSETIKRIARQLAGGH